MSILKSVGHVKTPPFANLKQASSYSIEPSLAGIFIPSTRPQTASFVLGIDACGTLFDLRIKTDLITVLVSVVLSRQLLLYLSKLEMTSVIFLCVQSNPRIFLRTRIELRIFT